MCDFVFSWEPSSHKIKIQISYRVFLCSLTKGEVEEIVRGALIERQLQIFAVKCPDNLPERESCRGCVHYENGVVKSPERPVTRSLLKYVLLL